MRRFHHDCLAGPLAKGDLRERAPLRVPVGHPVVVELTAQIVVDGQLGGPVGAYRGPDANGARQVRRCDPEVLHVTFPRLRPRLDVASDADTDADTEVDVLLDIDGDVLALVEADGLLDAPATKAHNT